MVRRRVVVSQWWWAIGSTFGGSRWRPREWAPVAVGDQQQHYRGGCQPPHGCRLARASTGVFNRRAGARHMLAAQTAGLSSRRQRSPRIWRHPGCAAVFSPVDRRQRHGRSLGSGRSVPDGLSSQSRRRRGGTGHGSPLSHRPWRPAQRRSDVGSTVASQTPHQRFQPPTGKRC